MSDIRSIGTAVESYAVDNGHPPDLFGEEMHISILRTSLEPTFIRKLPTVDAWGTPFKWSRKQASTDYRVASYGSDTMPTTFIADKSGVVRVVKKGFEQGDQGGELKKMRDELAKLVK